MSGEAETTGPVAKVWGFALVAIGVLLGVWLLFILVKALLPGIFVEFNGSLGVLSRGFMEGGFQLQQTGVTLGMWMSGWVAILIRVLLYVLLFAVAVYFFRLGMSKLRGGGGAPPAAH